MEPDKVLCEIIANQMTLDPGRVWVYDQNVDAPSDEDIYVVVSTGTTQVIGVKHRFDPDTNTEVQAAALSTTFNVEITSKNTDAKTRQHEVILALNSAYAQGLMEANGMRVFRTAQTLDLSFIEGASALHRYQIPVIIFHSKVKQPATDYFDGFRKPEVLNER